MQRQRQNERREASARNVHREREEKFAREHPFKPEITGEQDRGEFLSPSAHGLDCCSPRVALQRLRGGLRRIRRPRTSGCM